MERVKIGINGLDDMLNGGIPEGRHVALYGGPGSGKTSFCFEYLYKGAKMGEKGVYVTLEETPDDIVSNMKTTFPMLTETRELMDDGMLDIVKPEKLNLEEVANVVEDKITSDGVTRAVFDSATMIRLSFENDVQYRQTLFEFLSLLRNLDITTITTIEASKGQRSELNYDLEHFVMDGVINLYNLEREDRRVKSLEIFKMRGTDHSRDLVPFKITPNGIKVYKDETVF